MTWRPRIRTIKPETWADEKIGALTRDARLLFVGLITMADDEGRLRALPAAVIGHVFPYDHDVTAQKLGKWMSELETQGLVVTYQDAGRPYAWLTGWGRHQRINRPSPSELPPVPVNDVSVNGHVPVTERSVNDHGSISDASVPPAQARVPADRDQGSTPPTPLRGEPEFEDWLEHYRETTGHQVPSRGTKAFHSIVESYNARRAEGHPANDLKLATLGAHGDDYRREHGYDTASSILRPTKVGDLITRGRRRANAAPLTSVQIGEALRRSTVPTPPAA